MGESPLIIPDLILAIFLRLLNTKHRDGWEMKNVKKQWSWRKQWQLIRLFASKGPTDFRLTCEITEGDEAAILTTTS